MASTAKNFDWETTHVDVRNGKLQSDVEFLKRDVSDIKADIRAMRYDISATKEAVSSLELRMKDSFAAASKENDARFAEMNQRTDARFATLIEKMDARFTLERQRTDDSFSKVHEAIASLRVGRMADRASALLMAGAILGVMARGFGWL